MKKIPIVACNIGSPSVKLLIESVKLYASDHELIIHYCERSTFGQSYNEALQQAFEKYDEVIVSNDDVVLTPTSVSKLMEDVEKLKEVVPKNELGFVATMSDSARSVQNIRFQFLDNENIVYGKWQSENLIKCVPLVAPIFAYMSKHVFETCKFPPVTWWSDDIICDDLTNKGFKHFVSSSYVHHVGSSTIGHDYQKLVDEALPWLKENRPEYLNEYAKRRGAPL